MSSHEPYFTAQGHYSPTRHVKALRDQVLRLETRVGNLERENKALRSILGNVASGAMNAALAAAAPWAEYERRVAALPKDMRPDLHEIACRNIAQELGL